MSITSPKAARPLKQLFLRNTTITLVDNLVESHNVAFYEVVAQLVTQGTKNKEELVKRLGQATIIGKNHTAKKIGVGRRARRVYDTTRTKAEILSNKTGAAIFEVIDQAAQLGAKDDVAMTRRLKASNKKVPRYSESAVSTAMRKDGAAKRKKVAAKKTK